MGPKILLRGLARRLGYEIRRIGSGDYPRTSVSESLILLRRMGFRPETIVDVGVAQGTPELLDSFPESYFLLIEPLADFEPYLQSILRGHRGSYVLAAAGPSTGEVTFNVHENHLQGSSLLKESMGAEADGHETRVPMITIDDAVPERGLRGPYLLKIDVQGAELAVLDGAQWTLRDTDVILLEVSLFHFMRGAPDFYDVVKYMKDRGYVAYDIILGWNRPLDGALGQVDMVFVKEDGRFRQDHSYSTVQEMRRLFRS